MNILDNKPTDQNDQVQIDPNKNYLEELVGEGKKFKTPEEMARGKAESDAYIEHMKARMDELRQDYTKLRDEYNAGPKLKETLDQYMQELKQSQGANQPLGQEDKSVPLDENKISDLVKQQIAATKQFEAEENNAKSVESRLQETYGPNYKQLVSQQISQLGLSTDFFNDLARKHPAVLYRTLGLEGQRQKENFQTPPTSTHRSDPFGTSPKRTWSYYQQIRKTDPARYRDPKTQDQMFKDALELGDAFQDGNWIKPGR
jgi:hypothetical protein